MEGNRRIYIPVGIGIFDKNHIQGIGEAIWLFLWLIHKTTAEIDCPSGKIGVVLYGNSITSRTIADELGCSARTVRTHLQMLADSGYIDLEKTGTGQIIRVKKSMKWPARGQSAASGGADFRVRRSGGRPRNAIERLFMNSGDDDD